MGDPGLYLGPMTTLETLLFVLVVIVLFAVAFRMFKR
jgi:hypothetical protein